MNHLKIITLICFISLMALVSGGQTAQAATPLPSAPWYAVAWVQSTDTLHWVNPNGEQGSMERPKLANEAASPAVRRISISPNGQRMVIISSLTNGNLGIGFYDLNSGQFVQAHETQPGEVLPDYSQLVFSFNSAHFATALRNVNTGDWRIIVFETATGNAVDQLTRTSPIVPDNFITDPTWWPVLASYSVDEGIGQSFINLQLVSNLPTQTAFPSFKWYPNPVPAVANAPVIAAAMPFSPFAGFDVLATTKAVAFTGFDTQNGAPNSNVVGNFIGTHAAADQLPVPVVNGAGYTLNSAQWLKNGAWIGYRVQNDVQQPHYAVTSAQSDTSLPLGPNIGAINSTPDGFLATNSVDWQLYHATDLSMDAFAYQFGNTVFSSNGQPFSVIYTTPEGAVFSLASLPTEANLNVEVGGNGQIAAPEQTCGTAPAPRLSVGNEARVTFTDGQPLNVRTAAGGDFIMQIAEGTVVNVIGGPTCKDNYFWWNLQLQSEGVNVGGWAAEGDASEYYLEPFTSGGLELDKAAPPQPTAQPTLVLQVATVQPTPMQDLAIDPAIGDCSKAPAVAPNLKINEYAQTIATDGTYAMRAKISDEFPSNQVPGGKTVTVLNGPQCYNGLRMWYVTLTVNGNQMTGWVADGFGSNYYLKYGPARAK